MHIAIGYRFYAEALGFHMERALRTLRHTVTYVGLPAGERPGYDTSVSVADIISHMPDKPDLFLWIDPAGPYFPSGIETLPIPTACYLVDVHLGSWRLEAARFFDAVFIAQKDYMSSYIEATGHNQVVWLPLAYAPDVHKNLDLERIYDVGFVGNLARAHKTTPRARRLKLIARRFRTNDFYRSYLPHEVGETYSKSRIVFNASIGGDVNMRVFEGAASGALVLTDSIANGLQDLFRVDQEVVTYTDDGDLLDKINHFLSHEEERSTIARAGCVRAAQEHTYLHRVADLLGLVMDPTFQRIAPMRTASAHEQYKARLTVYTHLHMVDAILDAARAGGKGPFGRLTAVYPALLRRLLL